MDVDPLEHVEDKDEKDDGGKSKSNLNRWVAVTVAILATFMGICKVKDDNIVQAMQQAQAPKSRRRRRSNSRTRRTRPTRLTTGSTFTTTSSTWQTRRSQSPSRCSPSRR
jgi:hypothetical protein